MKAYNLHGINDLRFEDVAEPACGNDSVVIRVRVAGICGSDIPRIYRTGTYHFPTIPGHEFSGQVMAVGADISPEWMNKRVGIFPLIPCMKCECCQDKHYEMCSDYNYLGSRCDGGFAEYVEVPQWNLIELPGNVTYEQAAMLEPLAVAIHAIRQSGVMKGDTVGIIGLGTIGLFIAMLLREMGIDNIYCIGNKDYQKDRVIELGIDGHNFCNLNESDSKQWILDKTCKQGVNVFFECVGKNETMLQAIEYTRPSGTVQLVGNPATDMLLPTDIYWRVLRKQLKVIGTWNSSFTHDTDDDWHYILDRLSTGGIHPEQMITHKLSFDELNKGLSVMKDKTENYIKIMMIN